MSSSEGPERVCVLEAGTYRTEFQIPELTYTVPAAGWASVNREISPGNLHLFPPGGMLSGMEDGTTDGISMISVVVPPGTCTGEPSTEFAGTFGGLVKFLTTNPHLQVSDVHDVSIGGLDGTTMDIAFLESDGCEDGTWADLFVGVEQSHGAFSITPTMAGIRLFLLHTPQGKAALAVWIDDAANGGSDFGDGEAWYSAAQDVIDTFEFRY